jgi:hypothetical protein
MGRKSRRELEREMQDLAGGTDTSTLDEFGRPGTADSVILPTDADIDALLTLDRDPTEAETHAVLTTDGDPTEVLDRRGVDV